MLYHNSICLSKTSHYELVFTIFSDEFFICSTEYIFSAGFLQKLV